DGRERNPTPALAIPAPPVAPEAADAMTEPEPGDLPGPDLVPTAPPELGVASPRAEDLPGLEDISDRAPPPPTSTDTGESPPRPADRPDVAGAKTEANPARVEALRLGEQAQHVGRLAEAERHFRAAVEAPAQQSLEPRRKLAE